MVLWDITEIILRSITGGTFVTLYCSCSHLFVSYLYTGKWRGITYFSLYQIHYWISISRVTGILETLRTQIHYGYKSQNLFWQLTNRITLWIVHGEGTSIVYDNCDLLKVSDSMDSYEISIFFSLKTISMIQPSSEKIPWKYIYRKIW